MAVPTPINATPLPSTNLGLQALTIQYGLTTNPYNLNTVASANAWTCASNTLSTYAKASTSNVNMGMFRGTLRFPVYAHVPGTKTLSTGPSGFPASWVASDNIQGYCDYGFDGVGGIIIGTFNGVAASSPAPSLLFTIGSTSYILRQLLYNTNRGQGIIRISTTAGGASPPTGIVLGGFDIPSGTGDFGTFSAGTQENVSGDYTTYWTFSPGTALFFYSGNVVIQTP